ncbi:unnamed protein product, partial [Prorocentrum cordatum]
MKAGGLRARERWRAAGGGSGRDSAERRGSRGWAQAQPAVFIKEYLVFKVGPEAVADLWNRRAKWVTNLGEFCIQGHSIPTETSLSRILIRNFEGEAVEASPLKGLIRMAGLWGLKALYDSLDWLRHVGAADELDFPSSVTVRSWVDDSNTRIVAPRKFAVKQLVGVFKVLSESCMKLGLAISPASVAPSSSKTAGCLLESKLKALGLKAPLKEAAVDLGVDRGRIRALLQWRRTLGDFLKRTTSQRSLTAQLQLDMGHKGPAITTTMDVMNSRLRKDGGNSSSGALQVPLSQLMAAAPPRGAGGGGLHLGQCRAPGAGRGLDLDRLAAAIPEECDLDAITDLLFDSFPDEFVGPGLLPRALGPVAAAWNDGLVWSQKAACALALRDSFKRRLEEPSICRPRGRQ